MQNSKRSPSSPEQPAVDQTVRAPASERVPHDVTASVTNEQPSLVRTLAATALVISLIAVASLTSFPEAGKFGVILSATLGLMAVHLALRGADTSPKAKSASHSLEAAGHLERRFEQ